MKILIKGEQIQALFENRKEITYFSFFTHLKNFLVSLLSDPINAKASQELRDYLNLNDKEIIEKLIDFDLLRRDTKIKETPKDVTANGKSKVSFSLTYSVPKKEFKNNVKRFYDKYVNV